MATIFRTPELYREELNALARIEEVWEAITRTSSQPRVWVGTIRRVLSALAVQGSNAIEGHVVSTEDAMAAAYGGDMAAKEADALAVQGYQRAMTYALAVARSGRPISVDTLLAMHFMMTEKSPPHVRPGLLRESQVFVTSEEDGETVYEGAPDEQVPDLVDAVLADANAANDTPPVVRAAMVHLNLVQVHPFLDGNGRMSRALQTLVLVRGGVSAWPEFCSIEEYLGRKRNTLAYYDTLGAVGGPAWNPAGDARLWVRFCLQAHYVQAQSVARRIDEMSRMWIQVEELREAAKLPERFGDTLVNAALGHKVGNQGHRDAVAQAYREELTPDTAGRDFTAMVAAGLLVSSGRGRNTTYVAGPKLTTIRNHVVHNRQPLDTTGLFGRDLTVGI